MNQEYIIINKTTLEKKIEELNVDWKERNDAGDAQWCTLECTLIAGQLIALERILYQSTSLIPQIEEAFDAGQKLSDRSQLYVPDFYWTKEEYISNFKLDI
jgi:hypothetical protein